MKGYTIDKRNPLRPYIAQINIDGLTTKLGSFATPEEATARYLEERAKHPRNPRSGGNPGYMHPKQRCKICGGDYSTTHYARHYEKCLQKFKEDFPDVELESNRLESVPEISVPHRKKRYAPRAASCKFLSRVSR